MDELGYPIFYEDGSQPWQEVEKVVSAPKETIPTTSFEQAVSDATAAKLATLEGAAKHSEVVKIPTEMTLSPPVEETPVEETAEEPVQTIT